MRRKNEPPEPPPPPAGLSEPAQILWNGSIQECKTAGRRELLRQACHTLERANQARRQVEEDGLTAKTETTGAVHAHPMIKTEMEARRQFVSIMQSLGLNEPDRPLSGLESLGL